MDRVDRAFAGLVCLAVVVGSISVVQYQGSLSATKLSSSLATEVSVDVTGVSVDGGRLDVDLTVSNPTGTGVTVRSGVFSVRANGTRVAAGSDDVGDVSVRPDERRSVAFAVPIDPETVDAVRTTTTRGGEGRLRGRVSMSVDEDRLFDGDEETFLVRFEVPIGETR
jgi:LEA14-like dessication related protein